MPTNSTPQPATAAGDASRAAGAVDPLRAIDAARVERGACRHCGGPVPCYSEFGDRQVGVRHSLRSWRAMSSARAAGHGAGK